MKKYLIAFISGIISAWIFGTGVVHCSDYSKEEAEQIDIWSEGKKTKYTEPTDSFKGKVELDQPDPGWYRNANDYKIPEEWPGWAKKRFEDLSDKISDKDKEHLSLWSKDSLKISSQWADSKAAKEKGYVLAKAPSEYAYFTFFKIEPDDGTIDQDFKGNARIYNLSEDIRYKIYCFDGKGYGGSSYTALSDKYVRVVKPGIDINLDFRSKGYKVLEDRNRNYYITAQLAGTPALFGFNPDGKPRWDYYPEGDWKAYSDFLVQENDLIQNRDGDIVYTLGYDYTASGGLYYSEGHITKIDELSGETRWARTDDDAYVGAIKRKDGGYVYLALDKAAIGGQSYTAYVANWRYVLSDEAYGIMGKVDDSGMLESWGNGAEVKKQGYNWWNIIKDRDENYIAVGSGNRENILNDWSAELTGLIGGSCVESGHSGISECARAFDGNFYTTWRDDGEPVWVGWDFGSGTSVRYIRFDINHNVEPPGGPHMDIEGSDNGVAWTDIEANIQGTSTNFYFNYGDLPGTLYDVVFDSEEFYRYYRLYLTGEGSQTGAQVFEWKMYRERVGGRGIDCSSSRPVDTWVSQIGDSYCYLAYDNRTTEWATYFADSGAVKPYVDRELASAEEIESVKFCGLRQFPSNEGTWIFQGSIGGGAWTNILTGILDTVPDGDATACSSFQISPSVTYDTYRLTNTNTFGAGDAAYVANIYGYNQAGNVFKIDGNNGISGPNEGDELFDTTFSADMYDISLAKDGETYTAIGRSGGSIYIVNLSKNGAINWEKYNDSGNTPWSIETAIENGGYVITSDYMNPDTGKTEIALLKIDDTGNEEWRKYFKFNNESNAIVRHAIETTDKGYLLTGTYYTGVSDYAVMAIKTNQFGESCSPGFPCE